MSARFLKILVFISALIPAALQAQVYEPEGINMPGEWNGWVNTNDAQAMGNFRMNHRDFGGGQYVSSLHIAASGGDTTAGSYQMLFTSGPDTDTFQNKWADATLTIDGISALTLSGAANNTVTVQNDNYYTFIFDDSGYGNTDLSVLKTSVEPVSITSVSGVPQNAVTADDPVSISVELDRPKSPEEKIYLRYSTDDFVSSDAVEITNFGSGTSGSATIPGQPKNGMVQFYVLTTTVDKSAWNNRIDLLTLAYEANNGENYSYFYEANISPKSNAIEVPRTPEITWFSTEHQAGYDLMVADNAGFTNPIINEQAINDTTFSVSSALDVNTKFYWKFKADTAANWSKVFNFTTASAILYANVQFPEQTAVEEGENTTFFGQVYAPGVTEAEGEPQNIQSWIGVSVSNSDPETWSESSWSSAAYNANSDISTIGNNDEYFAEVGANLSPGKYYYAYRFQYKAQDFEYGVIGGVWDDATQTLGRLQVLELPEPALPLDQEAGVSLTPELSWNASDPAIEEFQVQLSEASSFQNPLLLDETSTTKNVQISSGLLAHDTEYFWRVKSVYDTTATGWSEIRSFTTVENKPGKIALSKPVANAEDVSITPLFEWQSETAATSYELQVSDAVDFNSPSIDEANITSVQFQVPSLNQLNDASTYYWRVRGVSSSGNGVWSDTLSFTTQIPDVQLLTPANSDTALGLNPALTWGEVSGAQSYDVQLATEASFSNPVISSSALTDTLLEVGSSLNHSTEYFWRVRVQKNGMKSDWSASFSFKTKMNVPDQVVLTDPVDGSEDIAERPTFKWQDSNRASSYELQVSEDSTFTTTFKVQENGLNATQFALLPSQALEAATDYFWRVRGENSSGSGNWSEVSSFTTKIPTPELHTPADNAAMVAVNPTVKWKQDPAAQSYDIQVASNTGFTNLMLDTAAVSDTTLQVQNLNYNATYYWRARLTANQKTGEWSAPFTFSTRAEPPANPILSNPDSGAVNVNLSPELSWESSAGAVSYQVEVATQSDFQSEVVFDTTGYSQTHLPLASLSTNTTYFWRVRATNTQGSIGSWSSVGAFSTIPNPPAAPVLSAPADNEKNLSTPITFSWPVQQNADSYRFQYSTDNTFTFSYDTVLTDTELLLSSFNSGESYFWRVQATNAGGNSGWSQIHTFETGVGGYSGPELHSPEDGFTNATTTLDLSWGEDEAAQSYQVQVSDSAHFPQFVADTSGLVESSFTISELQYERSYFWRVRSEDDGGKSEWSEVFSFRVKAAKPNQVVLLSPADSLLDMGTPAVFTWSSIPEADGYEMSISKNKNFHFASDSVLTDTSITLNELKPGTGYFWRVRTQNENGNNSDWSAIHYVETGVGGYSGPELQYPEDGFLNASTAFDLSWGEDEAAQSYQVQVSDSAHFSKFITDTSGVVEPSFSLSGLQHESSYFWRVRSEDDGGKSKWSEVFSFRVKAAKPNQVVLLSPADSTLDINRSVTFSWSRVAQASSYQIKVSATQNFSTSIDSSVADTSLNLHNLHTDQAYYWKVRAINRTGKSSWSDVHYFTTRIELPAVPELINPEDGEERTAVVNFGWNKAERAAYYHLQVSETTAFDELVVDSTQIEGVSLKADDFEEATTYYWRARAANRAGFGSWSDTLSFTMRQLTSLESETIPTEFALHQNYPNPFNPTTNIRFDIKQAEAVQIQVFDLSGRLIQTLVDEHKQAGRFTVTFNASSLASGVYLMRMQTESFLKVKKMMLIK